MKVAQVRGAAHLTRGRARLLLPLAASPPQRVRNAARHPVGVAPSVGDRITPPTCMTRRPPHGGQPPGGLQERHRPTPPSSGPPLAVGPSRWQGKLPKPSWQRRRADRASPGSRRYAAAERPPGCRAGRRWGGTDVPPLSTGPTALLAADHCTPTADATTRTQPTHRTRGAPWPRLRPA